MWPTQRCSVDTKTVQHTSPTTQCRKEPRTLCTPGDCPHKTVSITYILCQGDYNRTRSSFLQGPVQCQEKMKTVMVETPQEQCDLEPQKVCTTATKMVPQLRRSQECVEVPKEVCAMSRVNPTIKTVPFIQNWCFKPEEVEKPVSRPPTTEPPTTKTPTTEPPTTEPPTTEPPTTAGKVTPYI